MVVLRDWLGKLWLLPKNASEKVTRAHRSSGVLLVIITALKIRYRSIGTMLTIPKINSNIWKTIDIAIEESIISMETLIRSQVTWF